MTTHEITIKIPYHKFQRIIPHYVRDCLYRGGESAEICAQDVKEFWHYLGSDSRYDIDDNIQFFIQEHHHERNDEYFAQDLVIWSQLANWINQNRHQPQKTESVNVVELGVINPKQREK